MQALLWTTRGGPLLLLLAGCTDKGGPSPGHDSASPQFLLGGDTLVDLPFTTAGDRPPEGVWELREDGAGDGADMSVTVTGDFEVTGDLGPLAPLEARGLTVTYSGDPDVAVIARGAATVEADGQTLTADLYAVIGDPALPDADWSEDQYGTRAILGLPSAPYPYDGSSYTDDSVLIFAPATLSDRGEVGVVTHIHGHNAVLADVVAAQFLVEQEAASGRDAVLIAPQGPYNAADGDFGRLMETDGHAHLVRDALSVLYRDGLLTRPDPGVQVITSHSGGYYCTARILAHGGLTIDAVHLFDSLYGFADSYEEFVLGGGIFRSVYTATGGTDDDNADLRDSLEADGVPVGTSFDDDSLSNEGVTIGSSSDSHSGCLYEQRAYARWLVNSGLERSPRAPPELLSAISDGDVTTVRWRHDRAPVSPTIRIEGSADGVSWTTLDEVEDAAGPGAGESTVDPAPWIRIRQVDPLLGLSAPSDVYGGTGAQVLVVDGFDRVLGGSWTAFTHDFAARLGVATGLGFSVASNEAVIRGDVALSDYPLVLWFLGDESVSDLTFDDDEKTAINAYVSAGGALIVSGSELGYATDASWLSGALRVSYLSDDAGSSTAGGYTFGTVYEEDYPDVLSGETTIWSYDTGGAAAVISDGRLIAVGFALETMDDATLSVALPELLSHLSG